MNVLTMTLEEIYALEHVTVTENDYYVYITPDAINGYYLVIEDRPFNKEVWETVEMLKQENYSKISVKKYREPSTYMSWGDTEIPIEEALERIQEVMDTSSQMIDSSNGWD